MYGIDFLIYPSSRKQICVCISRNAEVVIYYTVMQTCCEYHVDNRVEVVVDGYVQCLWTSTQ